MASGSVQKTSRAGRERRWVARWREYPGAPERSKTFDRKTEADAFLANTLASISVGAYVDPSRSRVTVREYYEVWAARQHWRPATRRTIKTTFDVHALPVLGDRPLSTLRRGDLESWAAGLKYARRPEGAPPKALAAGSVRLAMRHVSMMLQAAVDDGLLARNPAMGAKRPRGTGEPVEPLEADQVAALHDAAPGWFRVAVVLGAHAGLRQGEAAGLSADRVAWLKRELKVDRQLVTPKPGGEPGFGPLKTERSYRTIPLADPAVKALAAHAHDYGTGTDGLLLHRDGKPVSAQQFTHTWQKIRTQAGLPTVRFHALRHTYASVLLGAGVSVPAVADYLGHTPSVLLATYAHLMPADHERARVAVERAFAANIAGQSRDGAVPGGLE